MVDTNTNTNSASRISLQEEAERAGIFTKDDVVALVKEVRAELAAERSHNTKGESRI